MSIEPRETDPQDGGPLDGDGGDDRTVQVEAFATTVSSTTAVTESTAVSANASDMTEVLETTSVVETSVTVVETVERDETVETDQLTETTVVVERAEAVEAIGVAGPAAAEYAPTSEFVPTSPVPPAPESAPTAPRPRRRSVFLAAWLGSALAVGAATGGGILAATGTSDTKTPVAAPVAKPSPTPSVTGGVRADGTHYGSLQAFLLPMPDGFGPGPDEGLFGNDSAVTPDQLDAEVTELFGKLPASDLTSAKGAMESAHMTQGAVRTYLKSTSDLEFSILALQLDPMLAAKSTGDFLRIVKQSQEFRTGPAVPGHPEAQCVLPATVPGDKLDEMLCLATVGDTFVIAQAAGTVPMDQKSITSLFANQVDLLKNGPTK